MLGERLDNGPQAWLLSSWLASLRLCRRCCGKGEGEQMEQSFRTFCECRREAGQGQLVVVVE